MKRDEILENKEAVMKEREYLQEQTRTERIMRNDFQKKQSSGD